MAVLAEGDGWRIEKCERGIVRAALRGDAEDESATEYLENWQRIVEENAPVLHLLDASDLELKHLGRRWELARRMQQNRPLFKKSAVIGVTGAKRFMARVIIKASGRDNVRLFDDAAEAERWLLES